MGRLKQRVKQAERAVLGRVGAGCPDCGVRNPAKAETRIELADENEPQIIPCASCGWALVGGTLCRPVTLALGSRAGPPLTLAVRPDADLLATFTSDPDAPATTRWGNDLVRPEEDYRLRTYVAEVRRQALERWPSVHVEARGDRLLARAARPIEAADLEGRAVALEGLIEIAAAAAAAARAAVELPEPWPARLA